MAGAAQTQGRTIAAIMIFSLLIPFGAVAHHGANTNPELYLAENLVELDGEISRVLWRNPHPRLKMTVVDENGDKNDPTDPSTDPAMPQDPSVPQEAEDIRMAMPWGTCNATNEDLQGNEAAKEEWGCSGLVSAILSNPTLDPKH